MGRDGYLYVTTLPGGAEDASLGARGKVYRVNPRNGRRPRRVTRTPPAPGTLVKIIKVRANP